MEKKCAPALNPLPDTRPALMPPISWRSPGQTFPSNNAMSEIGKYLMERESSLKKESRLKRKVLVVDDSATVRQGI